MAALAMVRSKWFRSIALVVVFTFVAVSLFDTQNAVARVSWASSSIRSSSFGSHASEDKVHLIIPLNKDSLDRKACTTLASALIHGYHPIILNWNLQKDNSSDPLDHMQLAKLDAIHAYLQDMKDLIAEESLVLVADGGDMVFQLPMAHLLVRYEGMNRDRLAGEELVITGADKGCHPNHRTEPEVCDAAPESPLPPNAYGIDTGAFRDKHSRPRWSNTGTIIGTVSRMRSFFEFLHSDPKKSEWVTDQSPFNRLLASRSNLLTVDYYSHLFYTIGGDYDNFKIVTVPRPLDGVPSDSSRSTIPPFHAAAQLPKLGMAGVTGEIPPLLHFNLEIGKEAFLDTISKEEALQSALSQLWWSNGEERFMNIARKLLEEGRLSIHDQLHKGKAYRYSDICGDIVKESSFLQWS